MHKMVTLMRLFSSLKIKRLTFLLLLVKEVGAQLS